MLTSSNIFLSIIIPAYNEQNKIEQDLAILYEYLLKQNYEYEVIVVNDGSEDGTYEVVKSLYSKYRNLNCINYEINKGKGYAVKSGVLKAGGKYILFADAGTCVPYKEVEKGLNLLEDGYDVAIGSRALSESQIVKKQPTYRRIGSRIFGSFMRALMGIWKVHDTQCGFKMFKREAAYLIFNKNKIDGFMFDIETILNVKKLGLKLAEFPIAWENDPDTRFDPVWGSIKNFKELLKIKLFS